MTAAAFRPFLPILALLASPAAAAGFQDLAGLDVQLAAALGAEIGAPGGAAAPVDRRLKLLDCPQPVTVDAPIGGAVALRCQPVGWRIRVPLSREAGVPGAGGTMRLAAASRAEPVIRRGDPVELVAGTAAFSVSAQAVAQEDGAPGSRIRVKSDAKAAPLYAEVVGPGIVRLARFK